MSNEITKPEIMENENEEIETVEIEYLRETDAENPCKLDVEKLFLRMGDALTITKFAEDFNFNYSQVLASTKRPMDGEPYYENKRYYGRLQLMINNEAERINAMSIREWVEKILAENESKKETTWDDSIYKVGTKWYFRGQENQSIIVYRTTEYAVVRDLLPDGKETEVVKAWKWGTFRGNSPSATKHKEKPKK